jgi:carbon monoxide dehydrogenase subunit G
MDTIFRVNKSIDFVFKYLTNMDMFSSVHPVITQIDNIRNNEYLVHETLKFGWVPISFTYPVTIKENQIDNVIIIDAIILSIVKMNMTFTLKSEGSSTIVYERIIIKSFLPVKSRIRSIVKKQHVMLFKNMNVK